jgi:ubiquinone/menaquinone biosynthesis C-methylase UbiE
MAEQNPVARSYDQVAAEYTAQIANELAGKPLDRALLLAFAEQVGSTGPIADIGCGPGHVAAFLAEAGAETIGFDLSAGMVGQARGRFPALPFEQADMRALPLPDAALGGVVAFYSIIHLAPGDLRPTFREWRRVLKPGGRVLVAFHIGDEVVHLDEWWEQAVALDFRFLQLGAVAATLEEAGFEVEIRLRRAPYPGAEHPSQRGYVQARRSD